MTRFRGNRDSVSAALMLTALGGCVELNRESGTRAMMQPRPGFTTRPAHGAYVGRGDAFRAVGPVQPFELEIDSGDLIVTVGFDPQRSGPTLKGLIVPIVPTRLRPERTSSGALLHMVVWAVSPVGPVSFDLSAVRVVLPDGQLLSPVCDTKVVSLTSACVVRNTALSGTGRYSSSVMLPLPVDGYGHSPIDIELPVVEIGGRRIVLPRITASRISMWRFSTDY